MVFTRLLDGVEPGVIEEIRDAAAHVERVEDVSEVRARWLGHRLRAEVNVAADLDLSVAEGHAIAREVNHQLLHHLRYLDMAVGARGSDAGSWRGASPHPRAQSRRVTPSLTLSTT